MNSGMNEDAIISDLYKSFNQKIMLFCLWEVVQLIMEN